MKNIQKIYYLLSNKEKHLVCFIIILSTFNMILDLFSIGILIPLFASLTQQLEFNNEFFNFILGFLNYDLFKKTQYVVLIIFLIFLFKNFIILLLKWLENDLAYNFLQKNSKNLLNFYINKNYFFHLKTNSAELIKNVQSECNLVSFSVLKPFLSLISLLMSVITILLFLTAINFKITLITILFLTIIGIFFSTVTKKILRQLGKERNIYSGVVIKILQQIFSNIREIIISNKKTYFLDNFDNNNFRVLQSGLKSNFIYSIPRSLIEVSAVLLMGMVILYLNTSKVSFSETMLTLTTFVVGASRLMPGLSNIISNISTLTYNFNAIDIFNKNFFKFLEKKKEKKYQNQISFNKIQFRKINFKYPGKSNNVISNLNLDLKYNDKVGIIGESGSGKSTLVNLLIGLLKFNEGEILLDGKKIRKLGDNWYDIISYVPQNVLTIDENLKDNIILGDKKVNRIHLSKIMKVLKLNDLQKYYYNSKTIGERGSRVSGGQNQRIGLARALYKKSKILILDESLNSIDLKLRDTILDNILEIYKDKLVILVSHQLDVINKFNVILKLQNGKVVKLKK